MSLVAAKPYCTCPTEPVIAQCPHDEQKYVLQTVVPGPITQYDHPIDCEELGQNCLGAATYGTANCLAATIECTCGLLGGCVRAITNKQSPRRRIDGQPYSWKAYEVGDWEYDMVVYRRPKKNFLQRLFDC